MNAWDLVLLIYAHPIVRAVLGLLVANVLVGIAAAIKAREFRLAMLGDWLLNRAIPYLLGAGAVQLVILTVPQEWSGLGSALSSAVWLFVVGARAGAADPRGARRSAEALDDGESLARVYT